MHQLHATVLAVIACGLVTAAADAQDRSPLELVVQTGHRETLSQAVLSANGEFLVTGSTDQTAILWNARTGAMLRSFAGAGRYPKVAISGKGDRVLAGEDFWDTRTGRRLNRLSIGVLAVFALDSNRLAVGENKTVTLRDLETNSVLRTFGGWKPLHLSGDGRRLVTATEKDVVLWDASTGMRIRGFPLPGVRTFGAALSGDERTLVIGDALSITLWNASSGQKLRELDTTFHVKTPTSERSFATNCSCVSLNHDGTRVAAGFDHGTIVWNAATGVRLQVLVGEADGVLDPNGTTLVTRHHTNRTASLWDLTTGTRIRSFHGDVPDVICMHLSDDGESLASGSYYDGTAVLWDLKAGVLARTFRGYRGDLREPGWSTGAEEYLTSVCLSGDGSLLVTGGSNGQAIAWNARTGVQIRSIATGARIEGVQLSPDGQFLTTRSRSQTHWNITTGAKAAASAGPALKVAPVAASPYLSEDVVCRSPDGRRTFSRSREGFLNVIDSESQKPLCSLLSFDNGEDWLVITPDGLFDGSVNAVRRVAYRIAGTLDFVPLERYQQKFWQPGLLASIMKGEPPTATVSVGKSLPPKVRFGDRFRDGMELTSNRITVEAIAEARGEFPVKALRLLVDGRPYGGQRGIFKPVAPQSGESRASWEIELDPGRHTLKVLADTEYVQGASDQIEVTYKGAANPISDARLPSLFVLAVGISKYPATRRLDYASLDAQAVAEGYQKHSRSLYDKVEVKVIADEQATRREIFQGLQWLRGKMTSRSVGVFFFAGHGEKDKDGSLYFLPVDFDEQDLAGSSIDADVLKKQLAGIPGRLTMLLDACHSGSIDSGKSRGNGGLTDQLVRDLTAEENGLIVMCSALGHESAQESHQFRHGLFTVALLEGLEGKAEKTADGAVYLTALDAHVARRVKQLSKGQQNPVTGKPTSVRDFPVSKP